MATTDKIIIEIMFKAHDCLISRYMDESLREVLPDYNDDVEYRRVFVFERAGKERFLELSISLFGKDGVFKHLRFAPIPSLFINGELIFDSIPPRHRLIKTIQTCIDESFSRNDDAKSES